MYLERTPVVSERSIVFAKNIAKKMDAFEHSGVKFQSFLLDNLSTVIMLFSPFKEKKPLL